VLTVSVDIRFFANYTSVQIDHPSGDNCMIPDHVDSPLLCFIGAFARGHGYTCGGAGRLSNKPVRVLIGFPPGQATDVLGRALTVKMGQQLGQQFVVENKPGVAGIIATQAAMSSRRMLYVARHRAARWQLTRLYSKLPYDRSRTSCRWQGSRSCLWCW
jgi:hypothetical protein